MAVTEVFPASMTFFDAAVPAGHVGGSAGDTFWAADQSKSWVWQASAAAGGGSTADEAGAGTLASPGAGMGGAMHSSTTDDYVTCVLPTGTKDVYLLGLAAHSNCDVEIWLSTDGGSTYTIDYGRLTSMVSIGSNGGALWRYGHVLLRGLDASVHYAIKLVVLGGASAFYINSLILVDHTRILPTANKYVALGDSWTQGAGSSNTNSKGYAAQFAQMLRDQFKVSGRDGMGTGGFTFVNAGVSGDALYGTGPVVASGAGSPGKLGGFYRLWSQVFPELGDWLTILYGPNDLGPSGISAGEFGRNLYTCLCLIEDAIDTTKMAGVLVGTPGYIAPSMHVQYQIGQAWNDIPWFGDLATNYEQAVSAVYQACAPFPWVTVVPVYETMGEWSDLVEPNFNLGYNGDFGLHPGDQGHMVLAGAFLGSAKGILQSAITQGGRVLSAR